MEFRTLELRIMSAKDLKKVTLFSRMKAYAAVSIFDRGVHPIQTFRTSVDRDGGSNPAWNFPVKFTVDEAAARQDRLRLVFQIRCEGVIGDKNVGEVSVSVLELLDSPASAAGKQVVSYQVIRPSGKVKGQLTFSYQFGEKVSRATTPHKADEPVTAYPAAFPPTAGPSSAYAPGPTQPPPNWPPASGAYPPPAAAAYPPPAYGYPPPPAYGAYYPQPQPGYGFPAVQQPAKKNKFGLGLGAGLLGGALGGMLIGDMVSDAAAYDAGYDNGFDAGDDFGGFDF
ncbi:unnamed protein product [Cuscuta campestris]|uniref:C2 domain-containing protein n=1 Tax=Cuscuta campestris TaxID=132261 RepID=A0A484LSI4_9ASTE|nr:unnamed protein product [Cuscuta campestris]